ncbi:Cardiac-Enriched Fhl2-Interacting Protein, partial [Manis pentadactyla]
GQDRSPFPFFPLRSVGSQAPMSVWAVAASAMRNELTHPDLLGAPAQGSALMHQCSERPSPPAIKGSLPSHPGLGEPSSQQTNSSIPQLEFVPDSDTVVPVSAK